MKIPALVLLGGLCLAPLARGGDRPNILWITAEDHGPHLRCYGDGYATTPNLDALAAEGVLYRRAWSTAPVCAPARTTIITGVYPTCTGSQHMRSKVPLPGSIRMFPQLLREAGYYCTNNAKEDYNLEKPGKVWDESSRKAHWKNRADGQPFFAVFNYNQTHESGIRRRPHEPVHDPEEVRVPAYHPDTPEVRQDWAQYYDRLAVVDSKVGERLRELEEAGLAEDTIVFYFADHGPGLPRCKRFVYDSGLRVPMIVRIPERFRDPAAEGREAGAVSERLVGFIDLAPTVLSLAGLEPPAWMQGLAFLGEHAAPPARLLFGFRGRTDERRDFCRSVTDGRYVLIRNFLPHYPHGQRVAYMFQTPTTRVWHDLFLRGELSPERAFFWKPRPPVELYDLRTDPDEVVDLAASEDHAAVRERLERALADHMRAVRDLGFLPEAEMHARRGASAPYDLGRDPRRYDYDRLEAVARTAVGGSPEDVPGLVRGLADADAAIRYWCAVGLLCRGGGVVSEHRDALTGLRDDPSPSVRIVAAESLGRHGRPEDLDPAARLLLELSDLHANDVYTVIAALNAFDALGDATRPYRDRVAALPREAPSVPARMRTCVPKLLDHLLDEGGR